MRKVWNLVTTLILAVMILIIGVIYLPKFIGFEPMVVLSGSMEPTYHTGSLLYIKHVDQTDIEVGDVITFYIDVDTLVTHRVIDIDAENSTYSTKGDANEIADNNAVSYGDILGEPVFNIPKLGYLAQKLSGISGKIIYGTVVVVVLILMFLGDIVFSNKKEDQEEIDDDIKEIQD